MKIASATVLVGLFIGAVSSANAESFNNRGEDWVDKAIHNTTASSQEHYQSAPSAGFNNRGRDWVTRLSPGERSNPCDESLTATRPTGFNDKSYVDLYDSASQRNQAMAQSSSRRDNLC